MTPEQLLQPRYLVENGFWQCPFDIGQIIQFDKHGDYHDFFTGEVLWQDWQSERVEIKEQNSSKLYTAGSKVVFNLRAFVKYPHLFRRLEWWKYRDEKDMPKYIKFISNVLRLCDGCEALELSVGATCTKPLLYAVLFFLCVGK